MTRNTPLTEQGFDALAQRFEGDIQYDAHAHSTRFTRSEARAILQARGPDILETLIEYLERQVSRLEGMHEEVTNAWLRLLDFILRDLLESNALITRMPPGSPSDYRSINAWTTYTRVHFSQFFS